MNVLVYSNVISAEMHIATTIEIIQNHLDKKRLVSNKEVEYNKEQQEIINIPSLIYKNKRFTIERSEKRVSTVKSLAPLKKTIKSTSRKKSRKNSPKIKIQDDWFNLI